jgi:regulator of sigma D
MNQQELVSTLVAQHRNLRQILEKTITLSGSSIPLFDRILESLSEFRENLIEHLDLENNVFYKDYTKKETALGGTAAHANELTRQMDEIAKSVIAFLDSYRTPDQIKDSFKQFDKELKRVADTLSLRIEIEEEGIYNVYLSMEASFPTRH